MEDNSWLTTKDSQKPSPNLYILHKGEFQPFVETTEHPFPPQKSNVVAEKIYPFIENERLSSEPFHAPQNQENHLNVGLYHGFGTWFDWHSLRQDLMFLLQQQYSRRGGLFRFLAVFPEDLCASEADFNVRLWRQMSFFGAGELLEVEDTPSDDVQTQGRSFCVQMCGGLFSVTGLHPLSRDPARVFPYPALLFQVVEKVENIVQSIPYQHLVERKRPTDSPTL